MSRTTSLQLKATETNRVHSIKKMRERLNAQKKQLADFETHLDEMEKAAEERKDASGQGQ